MKKIFFALLTTTIFFTANAQVQRKKTALPADSTVNTSAKSSGGKKEMFKELNLTKEQRVKLKELRQDGKAKMDEVQNDSKLSDADKQLKVKALKAEQLKITMALLNEEQKEKLKQQRKQKKGQKDDDTMMEEQ